MARAEQWLLVYEHNNFVLERAGINIFYSNVRRAWRDMFIDAPPHGDAAACRV
jgi:hypothetical protein